MEKTKILTQLRKSLLLASALLMFFACNNNTKKQQYNEHAKQQITNNRSQISTIIKHVPPKQFAQAMQNAPKYMVVDLRTDTEIQKYGNLENAVNINYYQDNFEGLLADLDKTRPIFVYCDDGERSGKACVIMQDMHFKIVYDLKGGLKRWKKEGYKIVQP